MFIEPNYKNQRSGWIEVICGSMFSGKTEELLRRLKRARIAGQAVQVFKPLSENRYSEDSVVSHDENEMMSRPVVAAKDMLKLVKDVEVIGIDEAQFFDMELPLVCEKLAMDEKRVIVAGLDMDYKGRPFGPIPDLLAMSEYITKLHAICPHCGSLATHSWRKVASEQQVLLGEKDLYEPRCRTCFRMGNILELKSRKKDDRPHRDPELFE